jgi:hypothetical protein
MARRHGERRCDGIVHGKTKIVGGVMPLAAGCGAMPGGGDGGDDVGDKLTAL